MTLPRSQRHLLLRGATLVTLDPKGSVFLGDLLITQGRIAALGPRIPPPPATRLLEAQGLVVLPGLVRSHVHLAHRLARGWNVPEGRPGRAARLAALEAAHDEETAYTSVLLGAVECLLSGVTTVGEFGIPGATEGMIRALQDSGIRALVGVRNHQGNGRGRIRISSSQVGRVPCTDFGATIDSPLDVWEAMRQARRPRGELDPKSARDLLESVTLQSARALGVQEESGSLEPGKVGDAIVLDLEGPASFMSGDVSVYERVILGGGRAALRWVVVDGEVVVEKDFLPHVDEAALRRRSAQASVALRKSWESQNA